MFDVSSWHAKEVPPSPEIRIDRTFYSVHRSRFRRVGRSTCLHLVFAALRTLKELRQSSELRATIIEMTQTQNRGPSFEKLSSSNTSRVEVSLAKLRMLCFLRKSLKKSFAFSSLLRSPWRFRISRNSLCLMIFTLSADTTPCCTIRSKMTLFCIKTRGSCPVRLRKGDMDFSGVSRLSH